MTVLYYTQTYYLDAAIETIRSLDSANLDLHLVIEITPDSKCSNIINIASLENADAVTSFTALLGKETAANFKPYFKAVKSVQFLVFKKKKAFSIDALSALYRFSNLLDKIKPNVIHFDTVTLRSLLILPKIFGLKKVITIHDPIPHIGESTWKSRMTNRVYFSLANHFIFYSNFAKKQFEIQYPFCRQSRTVIQFQPYTYNQLFLKSMNASIHPYILFFGRISYYKGVDLFISIIPEILKRFPNQHFIIAGRTEGYEINEEMINKYKNNILFINEFIDSSDLVSLIQHAKFLVCPYRDASQSGVLMTAMAIGKPVIATNVGAFPEYIQDGYNGLIAEPNQDSILDRVLHYLEFDRYKEAETYVNNTFSQSIAASNQNLIAQTYFNE